MTKETFLTTFFNQLNESKIDYFVYGSYQSLPHDTGGSDIDIVVKEADMVRLEQILKAFIDGNEIVLASFYSNANAKFYRIISCLWGVQMDFFYKGLCYKGVSYYPIERLHRHLKMHNDIVRVLDQNVGFYVDYFKEAIHIGKVKDKYAQALLDLYSSDKDFVRSDIESLYGKKALDLIETNLSLAGLKDIAKELHGILRNVILKGNTLRVFRANVINIQRFFKKRPGYVIVVEGTDGSGKSFIINSITPILNGAFHNGVVYNHLRPNVIPDIAELMGKRKKAEKDKVTVVSDPHAGKQSGFIGSFIRWSYYMIDYTFGYLKTVWPAIHTKSKVFIFDRYYYEYYFDQKRSHTSLPKWILRIGEWLLPKPDLVLCLGGDPQKIYERKPETSLEEVTRQTNVLKDFCAKRKNAVWVDTTTAPEESIRCAMNAICDMMSHRFKNVVLR